MSSPKLHGATATVLLRLVSFEQRHPPDPLNVRLAPAPQVPRRSRLQPALVATSTAPLLLELLVDDESLQLDPAGRTLQLIAAVGPPQSSSPASTSAFGNDNEQRQVARLR